MKKKVKNIIFIIYVVIAVFVTVCLLSYNNMKVTEFGKTSLVIVDSNDLGEQYKKGDLLLVNNDSKIVNGESIFFYTTYNREIEINLAKVTSVENVTDKETTYTLEGDRKISSEYVLGSSRTTTAIPVVGTILGILESKWGFLFLIILPALLAFLHQVVTVVTELRGTNKENENEE